MHRTARLAFVASIALAMLASLVGAATPSDLPMSEDTFFCEDQMTRFWLVRGKDGEISHMVMQPWGADAERAERAHEPLPASRDR